MGTSNPHSVHSCGEGAVKLWVICSAVTYSSALHTLLCVSNAPRCAIWRCFLGRFPKLHLLVLLIRVHLVFKVRGIRSNGGVILTGEIRSTRRETWSSAALSTTYLTWSGLRSIPRLYGEMPVTNSLGHGMVSFAKTWRVMVKWKINIPLCSGLNR